MIPVLAEAAKSINSAADDKPQTLIIQCFSILLKQDLKRAGIRLLFFMTDVSKENGL